MGNTDDAAYDRMQASVRFSAIAWGVALPLMVAPFVGFHLLGLLPDGKWPWILLAPLACAMVMHGAMWLTVRLSPVSVMHRKRLRQTEQTASK